MARQLARRVLMTTQRARLFTTTKETRRQGEQGTGKPVPPPGRTTAKRVAHREASQSRFRLNAFFAETFQKRLAGWSRESSRDRGTAGGEERVQVRLLDSDPRLPDTYRWKLRS
jgi:hypothetical protein